MYVLKYNNHFSSAHYLKSAYTKKCHGTHGHNWFVKIEILALAIKDNMVIDFTKLKEIIDKYDHKVLNDIMSVEPTAENIAKSIFTDISNILSKEDNNIENLSVEIFENDNASITYNGEE